MLILGLLLLLLAAAVITYMILATNGMTDVHLDYGILNLDLPPLWLYLAGAITVAVAAIGLWLMAAGARAKARQAREVRALRKQAKESERRVERSGDASAPRIPRSSTARETTSSSSTRPVGDVRSTGSTEAYRPDGYRQDGPATGRPVEGSVEPRPDGSGPDGRNRLDLDR